MKDKARKPTTTPGSEPLAEEVPELPEGGTMLPMTKKIVRRLLEIEVLSTSV